MADRERALIRPILMAALALAAPGATAATTQDAAVATAPKGTADPANAPKVAPDLPLTSEPAPSAAATPPKDDLAALGDGDAPVDIQNGKWKTIAVEKRHMLIMGSSDGFAAAGAAAPCFPGRDNVKLDEQLIAAGFGDSYADKLPEALAKIAGEHSGCADQSARSYDAGYLMRMPDDSLAAYLTGAIRAYARVKPCPSEVQSYAASLAITTFGIAEEDTNPVTALRIALQEACTGPGKG